MDGLTNRYFPFNFEILKDRKIDRWQQKTREKVDYSRRVQMDVLYIDKQVSYSFLLFNLSFKDRKIDIINGKWIVLDIQRQIDGEFGKQVSYC